MISPGASTTTTSAAAANAGSGASSAAAAQAHPLSPDPGPGGRNPDPASPSASSTPHSELRTPHSDSLDPASLPSLTNEDELLAAVVAAAEPPAAIAARFGIRLSLFLDWLAAPQTRARVAALLDAEDIAFLQQHRAASTRALARLSTLLDSSDDPVEQRRAAAAIIRAGRRTFIHRASSSAPARHARSPLARAAAASRADRVERLFGPEGSAAPAPVILGPPERPQRAGPMPAQITISLLHRLQDIHNPAPYDGLRSLHNYLDSSWKHRNRAYEFDAFLAADFDQVNDLTDCHSAVLAPATYAHYNGSPCTLADAGPSATARQPISFIDAAGRRRSAVFHFQANHERVWQITDFEVPNPRARTGPAP